MTNFLKETIEFLESFHKTPDNVISIGNYEYRMDWETFKKNADFEYDDGFGIQEIYGDLMIFGDDFIATRYEYDGSESWEVFFMPDNTEPNITIKNKIKFNRNCEPYGNFSTQFKTLEQ